MKELVSRGWQLPCVYMLVVGRYEDRRVYTYKTLAEAEREGFDMLVNGRWDYATIYMKEVFKHVR